MGRHYHHGTFIHCFILIQHSTQRIETDIESHEYFFFTIKSTSKSTDLSALLPQWHISGKAVV